MEQEAQSSKSHRAEGWSGKREVWWCEQWVEEVGDWKEGVWVADSGRDVSMEASGSNRTERSHKEPGRKLSRPRVKEWVPPKTRSRKEIPAQEVSLIVRTKICPKRAPLDCHPELSLSNQQGWRQRFHSRCTLPVLSARSGGPRRNLLLFESQAPYLLKKKKKIDSC